MFDLTQHVAAYLDPHLVLPLLDFLLHKEIYSNQQDILAAKYSIISKSNMLDFANETHKKLFQIDTDMPDFANRRAAALATLSSLSSEIQSITSFLDTPELTAQLKQDKEHNLSLLRQHGIDESLVDKLYDYAMFQYQVGRYEEAGKALHQFAVLSTNQPLLQSSLWGRLASSILIHDWDTALDDLKKIQEYIDTTFTSHTQKLMDRTFLIHYSLFVFFNHPRGRDNIIDMFFQPAYLMTIEKECPWILRYLTTAVITNRRRRNMMKELVKVIELESYQYQDPVTEFVEALYCRVDFEAAQAKLQECEKVLANDFFLVSTLDDFIENARLFVFENYCRIHQGIDIGMLSQKLNLATMEGEKWIVNLIRNARMDAKIDSATNKVIMGTNFASAYKSEGTVKESVYQTVIERTRGFSFRTSVLASGIERREGEKKREKAEVVV